MKLFPRTSATLSLFACFAMLRACLAQMPEPAPAASSQPLSSLYARTQPEWLSSAVIYEIFPRSFSAQGNLDGVTAKLDDLQKLGVTVIWLMPIHPVGQLKKKGSEGSPYAVRDYYAIDPAYGNKESLHRLVDEAHRRGIKVILDIVANHTSFDSVMMSHPDFYKHDAQGKVLSPYDWTDVAALNYANPALRRYMTDMLLYWVREFHVDGYRCDAAGEVPTDFWEHARQELDRAHPGILMLAEASKPDLMRSAFDLDYSWPLMATLNNVFEHGRSAAAVETTLEEQARLFPKHTVHMRMFDDHDEQRALARYGAPGSLAAAALIFTLDGVPMLYSGMEVGDPTESGAPALFENLKVWWGAGQLRPAFPRFYSFLIPFRQHHPALLHGDTEWVHNSDEAHVVSYVRRSAQEEVLVAINLSNTAFRGTVEIAPRAWVEAEIPGGTQAPTALPALSLGAYQARFFTRAADSQAAASPATSTSSPHTSSQP